MPDKPRGHLNYDDRCVIEEGLKEGFSASRIARRLEVSPSTITHEVKTNRRGRPSKAKSVKPARKCAHYQECKHSRDLCSKCTQDKRRYACRYCNLVICADICEDFSPRVCELLDRWPYVCRCGQTKREHCNLPKYRYDARFAQDQARERLVDCRSGISISQQELDEMLDIVVPLIKNNGLSPEAIWLANPGRFPVSVRTFYNWMDANVVDIPAIYLPRKVRCRPRKKKASDPVKIDGHEYSDFLQLDSELRAKTVEMDSVLGYQTNTTQILSLHFVSMAFQIYLRLVDDTQKSVVDAFDMLEVALGSPEAFEAIFGIILTDRGSEFKAFEALEQSCLAPDKTRCKIYFCDPLSPGQKGRCERNHEELRRILPKGRSDFDALTKRDLAIAASHVNSYPRDSLYGRCPIDLAQLLLPEGFLELIGVEKLPLEEVVLKPSLFMHAVEQ